MTHHGPTRARSKRAWLLVGGALFLTAAWCCWSIQAASDYANRLYLLNGAVGQGDATAAERLLREGVNPNGMPSDWQVMWASIDHRQMLDPQWLRELPGRMQSRRFRYYPPLFSAGTPAMVRLLVHAGADPNGTGGQGFETPLMAAARGGNPALVKELLQSGARVNQRTPDGSTALHAATSDLQWGVLPGAEGPYGQVLHILLEHGAEVNARGPGGATALTFAEQSPHHKLVRILRAAGGQR